MKITYPLPFEGVILTRARSKSTKAVGTLPSLRKIIKALPFRHTPIVKTAELERVTFILDFTELDDRSVLFEIVQVIEELTEPLWKCKPCEFEWNLYDYAQGTLREDDATTSPPLGMTYKFGKAYDAAGGGYARGESGIFPPTTFSYRVEKRRYRGQGYWSTLGLYWIDFVSNGEIIKEKRGWPLQIDTKLLHKVRGGNFQQSPVGGKPTRRIFHPNFLEWFPSDSKEFMTTGILTVREARPILGFRIVRSEK